jgi:hypothetical protein
MPFSIWEYLRERTRDAVLAGFQDALDVAEQGDTEGSQHEAARRLVEKLGGSREAEGQQPGQLSAVAPLAPVARVAPVARGASLPSASINGEVGANGRLEAAPLAAVAPLAPPEAPRRPAEASAFDAELESRLNSAAAPSEPETPSEPRPATPPTGRRRRGRPPKKSEGSR